MCTVSTRQIVCVLGLIGIRLRTRPALPNPIPLPPSSAQSVQACPQLWYDLLDWRMACRVLHSLQVPTCIEVGSRFLFTDIQDSTKLWGAAPASMSVSLDKHHQVIRECIACHKGYEVKTVGDSFMIACSSSAAAVHIAADIQLRLQETPFPSAIRKVRANLHGPSAFPYPSVGGIARQ